MFYIKELKKIYKNKKVLITGHTGFKGAYVCVLLKYLGAKVYGYSLKEEKNSIYDILKKEYVLKNNKPFIADECYADVRNYKKLKNYIEKIKPDYILHMAAQALVLKGYDMPRYTYEVNVMGTVNLMEAIREVYGIYNKKSKVSILNVTTDKVYENDDIADYDFRENDKLCGLDPYANSKSCSELVTYSYKKSFFNNQNNIKISTARAGNVIGGGDMNENRIIPDCFRAIKNNKEMFVRNPLSIRPYQFVLEPLIMYLNIMAYQYKNDKYQGSYNIGPNKKNCLTTKELVEKFADTWHININKDIDKNENKNINQNSKIINNVFLNNIQKLKIHYANVKNESDKLAKHESKFLSLDNSLIKKIFGYKEIFNMDDNMKWTTEVYKLLLFNKPILPTIYKLFDENLY